MAQTDAEKLPIFMVREARGLAPASSVDAEALDRYRLGSTVEVRIRQRRSERQLRLYWVTLGIIVHNYGAENHWPTAEHLHDLLKVNLGYVRTVMDFKGDTLFWPDSTALSKMDQAEYQTFFNKAMDLLSEHLGFDVTGIKRRAAYELDT